MAYQSGEFSPPGLNLLGAPPAGGIFQDTLIVFGGTNDAALGNPKMIQTTLDLSKLIWQGNPPPNSEPLDTIALTLTSGSNTPWETQDMSLSSGGTPYTLARCGAATMPDGVYAFWNQWTGGTFGGAMNSSSAMCAAKYSGAWGPGIQLFESDGETRPTPFLDVGGTWPNINVEATADVSATGFGDSKVIVACAQASSANCPGGGIYLAIYDRTTISGDLNTWTADWSTYLINDQISYYQEVFPPAGTTGVNISIDWFAVATGTNTPLQYFLAISFAPQLGGQAATNGAMIYLPMNVSTTGQNSLSVSVAVPASGDLITMYRTTAPGTETGTILANPVVRDPAGRLRVYDLKDSQAGYFMTNQAPWVGDPLTWSSQVDQFTISDGFRIGPSGLFYVFDQGASQTTVDNIPTTSYPVYEFVFYNECQVNRYGSIEVIPNPNPSTLTPDTTSIITGIIDGPIPLPIANYQDFDPGGSQTEGGDITYGTKNSNTTVRQLSTTWTKGVETNGEVTKGVGPAWDVAFDHGVGSVSGNTQASSISYPLTLQAVISYKNGQPATITPNGVLLGVSAQLSITAYRFVDANGNLITDATTSEPGQASKIAAILTTLYNYDPLAYLPYAVTPGTLETYTPEALNIKMASLGYTASDNYYGDIICTNAYPFVSTSHPYLSFAWSGDSSTTPAFTNFNSSYTESSWTLDDKVYGGLSGGGGFSIFGIDIEEGQVSALAGVTLNQESTTTVNTESEWGIELSKGWGPHISSASGSVKHYEFRIFFLPVPTAPSRLPSNYWAQEVINNLPDGTAGGQKIDPNSCCWRIVFVVTAIQYNDPNQAPYQYDGSLDQASVYPVSPASTET